MKLKTLCTVLLLVVSNIIAHSQTLEGEVTNATSGEPLSGVAVIAYSASNQPIAFSRTNIKGLFAIKIPTGKEAARISFKMMGFETVDVAIEDYTPNIHIAMNEGIFKLDEVEVKPNKIRQMGDTLSYSVSAFRQKQDRSIADVISKMPGLEVKPSGEILYQGKQINKFYIEGMDLLGGAYSMASENIKADMVKSVQVYQDHQPIKVLKDIRFSDQAALNIVLKEEVKNIWQGTMDVGAGASLQSKGKFLRDLRVIEMLFSRKLQSISMYKTNNSGKNIEREIRDLTAAAASIKPESSIVEDITMSAPSLSRERYRINDTHIVASNWLFKTKGDDDIRFQLRGILDKTSMENRSERVFINMGNDGILLTEKQDVSRYRNEWTLENTYKSNKDNGYLSNNLKAYIDFNHSNGTIVHNGVSTRQRVEPRKRFVADDIEWIKSFANEKSFSIASHFIYDYLPATLLLFDGSLQNLSQHKTEWDLSTSFRHKIAGLNITYHTGVSIKKQGLKIDNRDTMMQANNYSQQYAFFMPSVSYKTPSFRIHAALQMRFMHRKFNGIHKNNLLIDPNILINYTLTSRWNTSLTYMQAWSPASYIQYITVPLYTNYYSMIVGDNMMRNTTMHNLSHRWQYNDVIHGMFGNILFSYIKIKGKPLYENRFNNNFYENKFTGLSSDDISYMLNAKIGKSIGWGKLSIALSGSSSWNNYSLMVAKTITDFRQNTLTAGVEVAYHPFDLLSIETKTSYNHSHRKQPENIVKPYSLGYFNHNLKILFMPGSWQIELKNEFFHSNGKAVNNSFFSDLSVGYKKKTWEATFTINNIFGLQDFERRYTSANQQVYSYTILRPRETLLKVSFSL